MNKVVLTGRLTRDPDVRYTQTENGQMTIARYTLAVDRKFGRDKQNNADFVSCVAFGKAAEFGEKYLKKGTKIVISGRLKTGSYTNNEGQKIYTTDVVVEEQEFAESKGHSEDREARDNTVIQNAGYSVDANGFMNIPDGIDEELPFN